MKLNKLFLLSRSKGNASYIGSAYFELKVIFLMKLCLLKLYYFLAILSYVIVTLRVLLFESEQVFEIL